MDPRPPDPETVCRHTVVTARDMSVVEMMVWCEDVTRRGWYWVETTNYVSVQRGMRLVVDPSSGEVLTKGQSIFGFSDPDVAFEFKVRWG